MQQHEGSLVLHVHVTSHLERADPLRAVSEQRDGEQNVAKFQLVAGEDRPGRDRKLERTGFALPLTPGLDGIERRAMATGAKRLTIVLGKPDFDERLPALILGHAGYALEIKRPCLCREKKMLRLALQCVTFASDMMI